MDLFYRFSKTLKNKMYIKENHRIDIPEVYETLDRMEDGEQVSVNMLVMIHYAFHQYDTDFDGGLNFLDRLHHKLAPYFEEIMWDLDGIKDIIRTSPKPEEAYYEILEQMLTPEMIAFYGI